MLAYEDWWFYPVAGGDMQRINLFRFYHYGASIERLKTMQLGDDSADQLRTLASATLALQGFLVHTTSMSFPLARLEAESMLKGVNEILRRWGAEKVLEGRDLMAVQNIMGVFELVFAKEASRVSAFSITPKGIYDLEKLIDEGEKKFP
ncbi:MAG TPA: hypothetical protein VLA93_02800, partial [Pyrinomonadaceae bacterium]|nr:hypothetical protein [Pyrinomonadaceae bacterium]